VRARLRVSKNIKFCSVLLFTSCVFCYTTLVSTNLPHTHTHTHTHTVCLSLSLSLYISLSDMIGFFNTARGKYQVWSCSPDRSVCVWSSAVSDVHVTLESMIDQVAQLSTEELKALQAHITRLLVPPPVPVSDLAISTTTVASSPSSLRRALPPPLSVRGDHPSPLAMSLPSSMASAPGDYGNNGAQHNPLAASLPPRRPPKLSPRPPTLRTPDKLQAPSLPARRGSR
jgi:hypothetical protein